MKLLLSFLFSFSLFSPLTAAAAAAAPPLPPPAPPTPASFQSVLSRDSYRKPFSSLAPRQKVMGVINTIAILRTKISLLEEMRTAFEPRSLPAPFSAGSALPGPALAYGDCRLGILSYDICRHLGFLESDPMVAPSSLQSKMLTLVGASSLVHSFKKGNVNLHDDEDLRSVLGEELIQYAIQTLGACWASQLLLPAFDAREPNPELIQKAVQYADAFLFQTAMQAKKILRFTRSSYNDAALWLARVFSDASPSLGPEEDIHRNKENNNNNVNYSDFFNLNLGKEPATARALSPSPADNYSIGGFLTKLFTPQQQQQQQQQQQLQLQQQPAAALSAVVNSMGNFTSLVSDTAQNAVRLAKRGKGILKGEGDKGEEDGLNETEKRLEDILSMFPEEVDWQF